MPTTPIEPVDISLASGLKPVEEPRRLLRMSDERPKPWVMASERRVLMRPPEHRQPVEEIQEAPRPRERWMHDRIDVTILSDALDGDDLPRVGLFGEINTATIRDGFCVVISDDGKLQYRLTREVGTVDFSAALMRERLGLIGGWALDRLVANPDSLLFNGIFQAAIWATLETPCTEETIRTGNAGLMHVVTVDCDQVVMGEDARVRFDDDQPQETAQVNFARLIPGRPGLVRALAEAIANPAGVGAFEAAATAAAAEFSPDAVLDAAQLDSASATARLGLSGGALTVEGVTAVLIGSHAEMVRSSKVTIDAVAFTGLWPEGQEPIADEEAYWNGLGWYLLVLGECPRRRR